MDTNFVSHFFIGNRQRLRQLIGDSTLVVVTANGLLQQGGDSTYVFTQDASFWYLSGISQPDILLVMEHNKEYLIVPERSESRMAFDGEVSYKDLSEASGVQAVYNDKTGWLKLKAALRKVKEVATLASPPAYIEEQGFYTNPSREVLTRKLTDYKANLKIIDIRPELTSLRVIKQPQELVAIQKAIDITGQALKEVTRPTKLKTYTYEYEIEAELSRSFRRQGAAGHAFLPIVASGSRACTLHNVANNGKVKSSDLLLIDSGAEVNHYAADITRVFSLSHPTKRQLAVHAAVLEVQKGAMELLRPGVQLKDYEKQVAQLMGDRLKRLGLIKTITAKSVRQYYPHSTSHFLGLNVHDTGDPHQPLEAGMVLTVEPGIYIAKEGIGVRIEDDVLITDSGIKVLSSKLPAGLDFNYNKY